MCYKQKCDMGLCFCLHIYYKHQSSTNVNIFLKFSSFVYNYWYKNIMVTWDKTSLLKKMLYAKIIIVFEVVHMLL